MSFTRRRASCYPPDESAEYHWCIEPKKQCCARLTMLSQTRFSRAHNITHDSQRRAIVRAGIGRAGRRTMDEDGVLLLVSRVCLCLIILTAKLAANDSSASCGSASFAFSRSLLQLFWRLCLAMAVSSLCR